MEHVPINTGHCGLLRLIVPKRAAKQVRDEAGIVALEVHDVQGGVQRPIGLFEIENFADGSVSSCHDARRFSLCNVMSARYAGRRHHGYWPINTHPVREVVPTLEFDNIAQRAVVPTHAPNSSKFLAIRAASSAASSFSPFKSMWMERKASSKSKSSSTASGATPT